MPVEHTLHTYGCLHFALIPITGTGSHLTTFDALWHTSTDVHTTTKKYCGKAKCNLLNSRKLRARARHSLDNLDGYLSDAVERYLNLGVQYHNVSFHTRAKTSKDDAYLPAHKQFGIESREWEDDDFFSKWLELQKRAKRVRQKLEELDEYLIEVINSCRALVGEIEASLEELDLGVKMLRIIWMGLWAEFDGAGKEKGRIVDRVERWIFEKWSGRIEGLKDRFYVEEEEEQQ